MNRVSATTRITVGLASLTVSIVLAAQTVGLFPDGRQMAMDGRVALCEAIAINASLFAADHELPKIEAALAAIVKRNEDVLSAGVRGDDGRLLVSLGDHAAHWRAASESPEPGSQLYVPIIAGSKEWGHVELRFRRLPAATWSLAHPLIQLSLFVGGMTMLVYYPYLRHILQYLDPSRVVPQRVRTAFDTLAEGLLVMDRDERIVLANRSFAEMLQRSAQELQGCRASDLPWVTGRAAGEVGAEDGPIAAPSADTSARPTYPWQQTLAEGTQRIGVVLGLLKVNAASRTFKVNTAPIVEDQGEVRGALASFDDITSMEQNRAELQRMLVELRTSRDEVCRQNRELEVLATRDPLTHCLNRRSLFAEFESFWAAAEQHDHELSCLMIDIDRFKSINDQHGHSVGDDVLCIVADVIRATVGAYPVCRYGGEEFCVLVPRQTLEETRAIGQRCREAIAAAHLRQVTFTASLGVSSRSLGARDPQELLEQADQSLYWAKRNGRNRVASWDHVRLHKDLEAGSGGAPRPGTEGLAETDVSISFHAVTALISALAFRDQATAEHSRRVADLCVAAGQGRMSISECYVLEIAGLLHDIGKVGVPDSILLKPGPLTPEEWQVMARHEEMGTEIIRAAFHCPALSEVVENHHAWYAGNPREPDLPTGGDIPFGARILALADAYDAIVSDRVYRKGRTAEEAFAELRRCAGTQFDPNLVESFIGAIQALDGDRQPGLAVSKQTALRIGTQIEKLAAAVDSQNLAALQDMAGRVRSTAARCNVPEIAQVAERLEKEAQRDPDYAELLALTNELLGLCRSTQRAYLPARAAIPEPAASR